MKERREWERREDKYQDQMEDPKTRDREMVLLEEGRRGERGDEEGEREIMKGQREEGDSQKRNRREGEKDEVGKERRDEAQVYVRLKEKKMGEEQRKMTEDERNDEREIEEETETCESVRENPEEMKEQRQITEDRHKGKEIEEGIQTRDPTRENPTMDFDLPDGETEGPTPSPSPSQTQRPPPPARTEEHPWEYVPDVSHSDLLSKHARTFVRFWAEMVAGLVVLGVTETCGAAGRLGRAVGRAVRSRRAPRGGQGRPHLPA